MRKQIVRSARLGKWRSIHAQPRRLCNHSLNNQLQIEEDGKVKVYGVTTKTRVPSLKDIPTLDEQGLKGFEVLVWHDIIYAPRGTPKRALDKLVGALQAALQDSNVKLRLADLGSEPVTQVKATPGALRAVLKSEIDKRDPIIKKPGQYAD